MGGPTALAVTDVGTPFDSLQAFRTALLDAVVQAAQGGARELVMVDRDFADWPMDDPALADALSAFARRPGRQLRLLALDYEPLRRGSPRFVAWRTTFGHAVDARVAPDDLADLPSLLVVDRVLAVRVDDRRAWRGQVVDSPPEVHVLRQAIDALLQRGDPGFAPTTLGL